MSDELLRLFPNASADFLRKNGFANIPPPRPMPSREVRGTAETHDLAPTLPETRPGGENASGAVTITLPYPPSANRYWATRVIFPKDKSKKPMAVTYVTNEAREYKENACRIASRYMRPLSGDVVFTMRIYRPRKVGDLSNRLKVVEDALEGACYFNDSQICRHVLERFDDKDNPRVEVTVRPVGV